MKNVKILGLLTLLTLSNLGFSSGGGGGGGGGGPAADGSAEGADTNRDANRQLIAAVQSKNIEAARQALARGANVNATDVSGKTALHWAAERGHVKMIRLLLEAGANVNATDVSGKTALHWAALRLNGGAVRHLLEAGADFNATDVSGKTALHWAALRLDGGAVRHLLEAGADFNVEDIHGHTALDIASMRGYQAIERILRRWPRQVAQARQRTRDLRYRAIISAKRRIGSPTCSGLDMVIATVPAARVFLLSEIRVIKPRTTDPLPGDAAAEGGAAE